MWGMCMHLFNNTYCWYDYRELPYNWIIVVPVLIAMLVSVVAGWWGEVS